ncbi:zinc-dependent alcohol dehydrogenase [Parafrankia sp. FMc2]|uniref:zinc-dependent alcohol dehydrogenase n=1 Tax=Parafrankia sp. FMc2 TaxID=3233196 RepID=UPI0034D5B12C
MKAVRSSAGAVGVVDIDEPPGTGELLTIRAASICSSDLLYVRLGLQQVVGHELAGVRADGSAVVVEAMMSCMECELCRSGRYNLCPVHRERALGATADGGMAEQFRAPAEHLVALPDGLDARDAPLVEPATVAWHAVRIAGTGPASRVAVVGAGALGLMAAAGARAQGAPEVAVDARYPHQAEAAERLGAAVGPSGLYDVVVEAAGTPSGLDRAIDLVAPGGIVVCIGVQLGRVEIDWGTLFHREARLLPSIGYGAHETGREMEDAAAMLAADPEIARALITHRFPLEDAAEAFRVAGDREAGALRVVVEL